MRGLRSYAALRVLVGVRAANRDTSLFTVKVKPMYCIG
jgi:hypothetical protein